MIVPFPLSGIAGSSEGYVSSVLGRTCKPFRFVVPDWTEPGVMVRDITWFNRSLNARYRGPWWLHGVSAPLGLFKVSVHPDRNLSFDMPQLARGIELEIHLVNTSASWKIVELSVEAHFDGEDRNEMKIGQQAFTEKMPKELMRSMP